MRVVSVLDSNLVTGREQEIYIMAETQNREIRDVDTGSSDSSDLENDADGLRGPHPPATHPRAPRGPLREETPMRQSRQATRTLRAKPHPESHPLIRRERIRRAPSSRDAIHFLPSEIRVSCETSDGFLMVQKAHRAAR